MLRSNRLLVVLALCLLTLSFSTVRAKDTWLEVRSKNYLLIGNASEKDIKKVGTRLEQFRETFRLLFKEARVGNTTPTTVIVFKSDGSYKPFKPKRGDGKIDEFVAGYFQPGDDVNFITLSMEGDDRETFDTIFHESVHSFVDANFGKTEVPTWFNEGLAEYYSTFEIEDDQTVKLGLPHDYHLQLLANVPMIPLSTLFNLSNEQMQAGGSHSRSIFYAESWAIIHYLIRNGKQAQLGQFLSSVMKGKDAEAAFKESFQSDFKSFEKELKKYVNQSQYQYQIITFAKKLTFASDMTTTTIDDAASNTYLGDLLVHIRRPDDAEPFLLNALKLQPTSSEANTALGFVKVGQAKFTDARKYLEAAMASDAKNYRAYYEYAYLLSREGRDEFGVGKELSKETVDKIREACKKAIALNPSYTRSYDMFAYISLSTGEQLDEAATYLQNALKYHPGDEMCLIRLSEIYLRQRKLDEAEAIVTKVAKKTDDDDVRQQAERVASNIRQTREYENREAAFRQQQNGNGISTVNGQAPVLKKGPTKTITAADLERVKAESINRSINEALRVPADGEQRVVGHVQKVECKRGQIAFTVAADSKTLTLTSKDFQGLQIMVFAPGADGISVGCGTDLSHTNTVLAYVPSPTGGELKALEFVPDDFRLMSKEELSEAPTTYIVTGGMPERSSDSEETKDTRSVDPDEAQRAAVIEHVRNSLAQPGPGEKREFGFLDKVECGEKDAYFIFHVGPRKLKLFNDPAATPALRVFTPDLEGMRFGCGIKPIDFPVVFIYKENPPKKKGDGTVVALDFVPKSFTLN